MYPFAKMTITTIYIEKKLKNPNNTGWTAESDQIQKSPPAATTILVFLYLIYKGT